MRPQFNGVPHDFAQSQIQDAIADVCLSIKAEDYFDLDRPQFVNIEVDLPDEARRLYDDMEKALFIELSNNKTVEAVNAAAKTVKCLQLANGARLHRRAAQLGRSSYGQTRRARLHCRGSRRRAPLSGVPI